MLLSKEQLISSLKTQRKLVQGFKNELYTLEKGKLTARYRNTRVELYQVLNEESGRVEKRIYESGARGSEIAKSLRRRWCVEKSIAILEKNIQCMEKIIKFYINFDPFYISESMPKPYKTNEWRFDGVPLRAGYDSNLISNLCLIGELDKKNTGIPLNSNENSIVLNSEGLKFDTGLGFKVRSKSEAIIAMVLHKYGLIYKYEMHLYINGKSYCPDFVIIDKNKEIIIWEHFGMMDNRNYQKAANKKVGDYLSEDLVIGKNFLITSETSRMPLDISVVEEFVARIAQGA